MTLRKPCLNCGEPTDGTRCPECRTATSRYRHKPSPENAGYDKAFRRLSKRARSLQPFCLDCAHPGSRDNPLTCEHLPGSWEKRERGERLTLSDVAVLCRECNSKRGPQRSVVTR
jgi:5-methylcytosine-specific restriction protein A